MMKIEHEERTGGGKFYIDESGDRQALLTYSLTGDSTLDIDHTEVDEEFRGEGIGQDLVAAAVNFARKRKLTVVARCPYAKKVIAENPNLQNEAA